MTNVERTRPLGETASLVSRRRRSGHVLLAEHVVAADLRRLRERCRVAVRGTGIDDHRTSMFVNVIDECVTNVVRHGGGQCGLIVIDDGAVLIAQVTDQRAGPSTQIPGQPPPSDALDMRRLRMAQQMVDRVTLATGRSGTTLRLEIAHNSTYHTHDESSHTEPDES